MSIVIFFNKIKRGGNKKLEMLGVYDYTNNYKKLEINFDCNLSESQKLPYLSGLYLNWVDKSQKERFGRQAFIIENYLRKKLPIVIYDQNMCISRKEFDWLKKFNVHFFEPALNYRKEFKYLPFWMEMKSINDFDLSIKGKKTVDLSYDKNIKDNIRSFDKYYRQYSEMYPKSVVTYYNDLPSNKRYEYRNSNMVEVNSIDWKDIKYTLIIDTYKNYTIGYLNPYIFEAMKNNCIPFIPAEHRYFNTMFRGLEISNFNDMNFFIESETFGNISSAIIHDIYEDIKRYYPEFTVEYASENIGSYFKKN